MNSLSRSDKLMRALLVVRNSKSLSHTRFKRITSLESDALPLRAAALQSLRLLFD